MLRNLTLVDIEEGWSYSFSSVVTKDIKKIFKSYPFQVNFDDIQNLEIS